MLPTMLSLPLLASALPQQQLLETQTILEFPEHTNFPFAAVVPCGDLRLSLSVGQHTVTERGMTLRSGDGGATWEECAGVVGSSPKAGAVKQTIEADPLSPFGDSESRAFLRMRSPYGPPAAAFEYDGAGTNAGTGVTVRWEAAQRISYQDMRRLEELERRVQELEAQVAGGNHRGDLTAGSAGLHRRSGPLRPAAAGRFAELEGRTTAP